MALVKLDWVKSIISIQFSDIYDWPILYIVVWLSDRAQLEDFLSSPQPILFHPCHAWAKFFRIKFLL